MKFKIKISFSIIVFILTSASLYCQDSASSLGDAFADAYTQKHTKWAVSDDYFDGLDWQMYDSYYSNDWIPGAFSGLLLSYSPVSPTLFYENNFWGIFYTGVKSLGLASFGAGAIGLALGSSNPLVVLAPLGGLVYLFSAWFDLWHFVDYYNDYYMLKSFDRPEPNFNQRNVSVGTHRSTEAVLAYTYNF